MLALDRFFNQLDHAVVHDKLHHRLAVDAANQHLAQQRVNNAMKLDELRVVCLAESEFSRWPGGRIAQCIRPTGTERYCIELSPHKKSEPVGRRFGFLTGST